MLVTSYDFKYDGNKEDPKFIKSIDDIAFYIGRTMGRNKIEKAKFTFEYDGKDVDINLKIFVMSSGSSDPWNYAFMKVMHDF